MSDYPRCPYCGSPSAERAQGCGAPCIRAAVPAGEPACPMCGGHLRAPWNLGDPWHCMNCGADVRGPLPLTRDREGVVVKP